MSDQSTYINTYIEFAVDTAHSYLNEVLQLKTQLKMSNELVAQKEHVIQVMTEEKKVHESNVVELHSTKDNAKRWEEQYHSVMNKVSHMDALTNQFNDLKRDFINKDKECEEYRNDIIKLKEEIKALKNPKKQSKDTAKIKTELTPIVPVVKKDINNTNINSSAVIDKEPEKVLQKSAVMKVEVKDENDDF